MIIGHNIPLLNASKNIDRSKNKIEKFKSKLSFDNQANISSDAVGVIISEKLRTQIRGLDQASSNTQNAITLIQVAEGCLGNMQGLIQRMRELAVKASNDTNSLTDREVIQDEINTLTEEINKNASNTEFNTMNLLDASVHTVLDENNKTGYITSEKALYNFQIGANKNQGILMDIFNMSAQNLGLSSVNGGSKAIINNQTADNDNIEITYTIGMKNLIGKNNNAEYAIDVSNHQNATAAISAFDHALMLVSSERSKLGAYENRLSYTLGYTDNTSLNLQKGDSQIRDVIITKEIIEMSKEILIQNFAESVYAQANQTPKSVIELLK